MKRSPLGLCLVAVVLAVVGCAQPATAGRTPPVPPGALPAALTPGEDALLLYAEDVLISRCMARSGLEFTAVEPSAAALRQSADHPYGTDDIVYARAHGYGFADGDAVPDDGVQDDPNQDRLQDAPPSTQVQYEETLYGRQDQLDRVPLSDGRTLEIAVQGCVADARRQLYGNVVTYLTADFIAVNLEGHIAQEVRASAGYVHALAAWKGCVKAGGLAVADPDAARQAGAQAARTGGHAAEVAVASTDAECGRSSSLVERAAAAERDLWSRVDAGMLHQVAVYRTLRAAGLPAARTATGLNP